ncbi:fimbrial protein, partial [Klebsiella pneumoniae]|uniref:fimbrial protein n=1 Tax=Klebsiella pneumoniae TaxID=573 RepID=UPI00390C5278
NRLIRCVCGKKIGPDPRNFNQRVSLGRNDLLIRTFLSLIGAGSASAWHSVALDLSNCPVGTSRVKATFSGTADSTGYYKNQGTAGNIQLELQNEDGTTLNNGSSQSVQVDEASQSARFPLQVRALSVNGGATQGTIQAVINVTYTFA